MNNLTFPVAFVAKALTNFRPPDDLKNRLLEKHHIQPSWLTQRKKRVGSDNIANLLQECMLAMGDEQLGHADVPHPTGTWTTMAELAIDTENLGMALSRVARFYRIISWAIETEMEVTGDTASFSMRPRNGNDFSPYLFESFLFYVHRFSCWLINQPLPLIKVTFSFPRPWYFREYGPLFDTESIAFDGNDSHLEFPASLLAIPLQQDHRSLRRFLEHPNLAMVMPYNQNKSWRRKVESELHRRIGTHSNIETIAKSLGVHHHTLRKRLRAERVRFNEVRDRFLSDRALKMLQQKDRTIEEIALALGYSETSTFSRAFTRWFGAPPSHYRRKVESGTRPDHSPGSGLGGG